MCTEIINGVKQKSPNSATCCNLPNSASQQPCSPPPEIEYCAAKHLHSKERLKSYGEKKGTKTNKHHLTELCWIQSDTNSLLFQHLLL